MTLPHWLKPLLIRFSVLLCAGAGASYSAAAGEQLVYWPLVTNKAEYRRVPYPREAGSLLVLADTAVVIEARHAPVSYWPITREYLADFAKQPQPVDGRLEIADHAGKITVIEPRPYLLWHPQGAAAGPAELIHGSQVQKFYEDYVQAARSAAAQAQEYQRIVVEHHAAVEAWLKLAAERRVNLPPPPPELSLEEPERYTAYATEPAVGFVVSLPEGSYTLRMRTSNGDVIPGSERELVSFGALSRGVGYVVRPEDRWTQPVMSFAPGETLYTTGRTDLFLQPVPVAQYGAQHLARLFRPQTIEVVDPFLTVWVPHDEGGQKSHAILLSMRKDGNQVATLMTKSYRVSQLPDASRGYVIEEFSPQEQGALEPDFTAARIGRDLPADSFGLAGGEHNEPSGGERNIVRVTVPATLWLFIPALFPLFLGLAVRAGGRMRRRANTARVHHIATGATMSR